MGPDLRVGQAPVRRCCASAQARICAIVNRGSLELRTLRERQQLRQGRVADQTAPPLRRPLSTASQVSPVATICPERGFGHWPVRR